MIEEEVTVEYTAGKKSGIFRFQFPANEEANLLLGHYYNDGHYLVTSDNTISGVEFSPRSRAIASRGI